MSYRVFRGESWVVVCDLCGDVGPVFSPELRQTRSDTNGESLHLCSGCRRIACWCETHQCYHRPDDLHRTECSVCGGLFTARVDQELKHCPGCRRTHLATARVRPREDSMGLIEMLWNLARKQQ